jgi:hypothetical protein
MTRIFLAASEELAEDRKTFEQDIFRRSQVWQAKGYRLEPVLWESFDDSMSATGKQGDYDAAIAEADIFVVLVHTKLGKYTREEFEVALKLFKASGKPRIYTYFKGIPEPGEPEPGLQYATVREFLARLAALGHWPNNYDEPTQMLHHFGTQLERLWASDFIEREAALSEGSRAALPAGERAASVGRDNLGNNNTGNQRIKTGGGAVVMGGVNIGKGSFVGRDKKK